MAVFREDRTRSIGDRRKDGGDDSLFASGADEVAACALPEDSLYAVDQDRLSGTGLTGERIEALFQRDDSGFDDGEVFD